MSGGCSYWIVRGDIDSLFSLGSTERTTDRPHADGYLNECSGLGIKTFECLISQSIERCPHNETWHVNFHECEPFQEGPPPPQCPRPQCERTFEKASYLFGLPSLLNDCERGPNAMVWYYTFRRAQEIQERNNRLYAPNPKACDKRDEGMDQERRV